MTSTQNLPCLSQEKPSAIGNTTCFPSIQRLFFMARFAVVHLNNLTCVPVFKAVDVCPVLWLGRQGIGVVHGAKRGRRVRLRAENMPQVVGPYLRVHLGVVGGLGWDWDLKHHPRTTSKPTVGCSRCHSG